MKRYCATCGEVAELNHCACARARERARVARRGDLYHGEWPAHSRERRADEPWCHADEVGLPACYATTDLTVDHGTDLPLCRSCHGRLEARRRRRALDVSARKG